MPPKKVEINDRDDFNVLDNCNVSSIKTVN